MTKALNVKPVSRIANPFTDIVWTHQQTRYAVPMYESEQGGEWGGGKIDGYAGPFLTLEQAQSFTTAYNAFYNNEKTVPAYYIVAQAPIPYRKELPLTYKTKVNGVEYGTVATINNGTTYQQEKEVMKTTQQQTTAGTKPPYERLFLNNKMAVILGKRRVWCTDGEHYHNTGQYATDRTLVAALLTNDLQAFQDAYTAISGTRLDPDFQLKDLAIFWIPLGQKFRIYWDPETSEEDIQNYEHIDWLVAEPLVGDA